MVNLQQNKETIVHNTSMQKPISMIQYWVNTGEQPYTKYFNKQLYSDSGSSFTEESLKSFETENSKSSVVYSTLKKHYDINKVSFNRFLKTASASSSSVDTADYILANKNTTQKKDTIAIVGGSKSVNRKLLYKPYSTRSIRNNNDDAIKYFKYANTNQQKAIKGKLLERRKNNMHKIPYSESIDRNDNNLQNTNIDQKKIISEKPINKKIHYYESLLNIQNDFTITDKYIQDLSVNHKKIQSKRLTKNLNLVLFSDSDESNIKSKYNSSQCANSQKSQNKICQNHLLDYSKTKSSLSKMGKRRKLYNSSKCFSNISINEQNSCTSSPTIQSKQFDHPGLEISKYTLKLSNQTKNLKKQYKNANNRSSLLKINNQNKHKISEICNQKYHNETNGNSNNLEIVSTINNSSNNFNDIVKHIGNREREIENKKLHTLDLLNNLNSSLILKFQLKDLIIKLRRLPYTYENSNLTTNANENINNESFMETDRDKRKYVIKNFQNIQTNFNSNLSNLKNDLFQNSISNERNNLKTFTENISNSSIKNENKYYNLKISSVNKFSNTSTKNNSQIIKKITKKSKMPSPLEKSTIKKFKRNKENTVLKEPRTYLLDLPSNETELNIKLKNDLLLLNNKILGQALENKNNCKNTDNSTIEKLKSSSSAENLKLLKRSYEQKKSKFKKLKKFNQNNLPNKTRINGLAVPSSDEFEPINEVENNQASNDKIFNKSIQNESNYSNIADISLNKSKCTMLEIMKTPSKKLSLQTSMISNNTERQQKLPNETTNYIPIISSSDELESDMSSKDNQSTLSKKIFSKIVKNKNNYKKFENSLFHKSKAIISKQKLEIAKTSSKSPPEDNFLQQISMIRKSKEFQEKCVPKLNMKYIPVISSSDESK
jgi:hypothetical protein